MLHSQSTISVIFVKTRIYAGSEDVACDLTITQIFKDKELYSEKKEEI